MSTQAFLKWLVQGIRPAFSDHYTLALAAELCHSFPAAPCPLSWTLSLRLHTQREETAKCVSWKGGEVEKALPAPRITAAPPEPPPLAFLQRQQKFPERGASANSNRAHSPLCGPPAAHVGLRWASWGLAAAGALWIKVTAMSQLL